MFFDPQIVVVLPSVDSDRRECNYFRCYTKHTHPGGKRGTHANWDRRQFFGWWLFQWGNQIFTVLWIFCGGAYLTRHETRELWTVSSRATTVVFYRAATVQLHPSHGCVWRHPLHLSRILNSNLIKLTLIFPVILSPCPMSPRCPLLSQDNQMSAHRFQTYYMVTGELCQRLPLKFVTSENTLLDGGSVVTTVCKGSRRFSSAT